jgi:hypothetical protein
MEEKSGKRDWKQASARYAHPNRAFSFFQPSPASLINEIIQNTLAIPPLTSHSGVELSGQFIFFIRRIFHAGIKRSYFK